MMDSMKKAIMKRRSKLQGPLDMDPEMMDMDDAETQEKKDDEGLSGLAPVRKESMEEEEMSVPMEEDGEEKELLGPMEEMDQEVGSEMQSESGLSPEELEAIANDIMKGMNKQKPGIMGKAAMLMKGSLKK